MLNGEEVMAIGMFHRNNFIDWLRLRLNYGALAGTRAVDIDLWERMTQDFKHKRPQGWEMEAALNTYTRLVKDEDGIKLNRKIGKVLMPEVVNIGSRVKTGSLRRGLVRMFNIHTSALLGFAKFGTKL